MSITTQVKITFSNCCFVIPLSVPIPSQNLLFFLYFALYLHQFALDSNAFCRLVSSINSAFSLMFSIKSWLYIGVSKHCKCYSLIFVLFCLLTFSCAFDVFDTWDFWICDFVSVFKTSYCFLPGLLLVLCDIRYRAMFDVVIWCRCLVELIYFIQKSFNSQCF